MKILYNTDTNKIQKYPRNDDNPISGLSSNFIVLTQIDSNPPDYNSNNQTISFQYITDLNTLEYRQEWTIRELHPPIPTPDWDAFNGAVFANERFNQVFSQAIGIRPLLAVSLPTAMDQVTTKGLTLFASLYGAVCALGGATAEDKLEWGQLARNANLPPEFIEVVES